MLVPIKPVEHGQHETRDHDRSFPPVALPRWSDGHYDSLSRLTPPLAVCSYSSTRIRDLIADASLTAYQAPRQRSIFPPASPNSA